MLYSFLLMEAWITPHINSWDPVRSTYGAGLHSLFDAVLAEPLPASMLEQVLRLDVLAPKRAEFEPLQLDREQ